VINNNSHLKPLVVATGIAKSYPKVRALAPLSFAIQPGERVALTGSSGSGKPTLLYLLGGSRRIACSIGFWHLEALVTPAIA
jgi:ABC-type sugar transport system ATPase subunit